MLSGLFLDPSLGTMSAMEAAAVGGAGPGMAGPSGSSVGSPASIEGHGGLPGDLTDVMGPTDVTASSTKPGRAPASVPQA